MRLRRPLLKAAGESTAEYCQCKQVFITVQEFFVDIVTDYELYAYIFAVVSNQKTALSQ